MTKLYTKLALAALSVVAFTLGAKAQNVIYSQTFSGAIPAGWTTSPVATAGGFNGWVWENATLAAANASTYRIAPIASTTAADGWMLFDSDRDCSGTQDAKLISPVINCTGKPTVVIEFQEFYRKYVDSTALMVSGDGGATWTYMRIKENVCTNTQYCSSDPTGHAAATGNNPTTVQIDISSVAANNANVKFGFRFVSNAALGAQAGCAYQWKIDDVRVLDGITTYASNYKVKLPLRPDNYLFPSAQLSPLSFATLATNLGTQARTNVASTVKVTENIPAAPVLFTNTRNTPWGGAGTISLGVPGSGTDTATILHTATYTPPSTPNAFYKFQYDLTADAPSLLPNNSTYSNTFGVSDSTFLKTTWNLTANEPWVANATTTGSATATSLEWGVFYDVVNGAPSVNTKATTVYYSVAKPGPTKFAGETIVANLYKWDDANADNSIDFTTELTQVGLATENLDSTFYTNFDIRTLAMADFTTGAYGVTLDAGGKYFVSITAPVEVYIGYDNRLLDNDYASVTQGLHPLDASGAGTWFSGFSSGVIPVIGLNVKTMTATDAPKNTAFKTNVFPNPTADVVNMVTSFGAATNATYEITDFTGKILFTESHKNVTNDTFTYNTRTLAAGTYNIVLRTDAGVQTSRFTVVK